MSSIVGVSFGNTYREKFGYLIITAILVFICSTTITLLAQAVAVPEFYAKYSLFYTMLGALIGIMASQLFIKMHIKSIRRGRI